MTTAPTTHPAQGVIANVVEAWKAHDADAFADQFTATATMTLPGTFVRGREDIGRFMRGAFAGPYRGSRVTGTPVSMHPLGADAVVLVTEGGVVHEGQDDVDQASAIRALWVLVREDDAWRLAAYQNTPRTAAA